MGASLTTRVRSQALLDRMLAFLEREYRPWSEVPSSAKRSRVPNDGARAVFGNSSGCVFGTEFYGVFYGWERAYISSLTRWVALRIGRVRERFSKSVVGTYVFHDPVPYLLYDGYEYWPVLRYPNTVVGRRAARKLPPKVRWAAVDRVGVYLLRTNESLVTCAEAYHEDPGYIRESNALWAGSEKDTSEERSAKLELWRKLKTKYAQPEVRRVVGELREELRRLDRAWRA